MTQIPGSHIKKFESRPNYIGVKELSRYLNGVEKIEKLVFIRTFSRYTHLRPHKYSLKPPSVHIKNIQSTFNSIKSILQHRHNTEENIL